jgi:hypothetical protein
LTDGDITELIRQVRGASSFSSINLNLLRLIIDIIAHLLKSLIAVFDGIYNYSALWKKYAYLIKFQHSAPAAEGGGSRSILFCSLK